MNKILLVDDDLELTQLLTEILTLEGFEVTVAEDGEEGPLADAETQIVDRRKSAVALADGLDLEIEGARAVRCGGSGHGGGDGHRFTWRP